MKQKILFVFVIAKGKITDLTTIICSLFSCILSTTHPSASHLYSWDTGKSNQLCLWQCTLNTHITYVSFLKSVFVCKFLIQRTCSFLFFSWPSLCFMKIDINKATLKELNKNPTSNIFRLSKINQLLFPVAQTECILISFDLEEKLSICQLLCKCNSLSEGQY